MQRISITNPQNIIDGTAKKYYFKLRNTGGPKGDKGDTGATGPQGPQGDPCTVVVNSTATLEPGSNAYVTNTGSLSNAVLNFGIPKGDQGPQGAKGDKGDTGAKGDTGPRGPQGEKGTNATVCIGTTSTLNPGTQATVYNSGTDSNAVLNFGIPKGDKGDTGATGATGPAGQDGQNFTPTIVAELPATGEEGKLYLTPKAHATQTATGNPITATVTEDAGNIESFQLDGDTLQNGTPTSEEPVPIQTVTGTQVISIAKSVIPDDVTLENARLNSNGTINKNISNRICTISSIPVEPNTTYRFSVSSGDSSKTLQAYFVGYASQDGSGIGAYPNGANWADPPFSITTDEGCHYVRVGLRFSDDSNMTLTSVQDMQLSNPRNYTVSLGNLELRAIGDDKDRIYNSGDNWYIHRAISIIEPTGDESYSFFEGMARFSVSGVKTGTNARIASTHFEWSYRNAPNKCYVSTSSLIAMGIPNVTTEAETKSWVAANKPVFYCPLLNATDTLITDTALIAQLEAIRTASLQNGANTITNTATGSNLAGDMEVSYYGYNPTNRYDKFIWLDLNNNYEQIGE